MRSLPILALIFLSGCTIHRGAVISPANIGPKETATEVVSGSAAGYYVLFFGPFGDNSVNAAIDNALQGRRGASLLNVFVDRTFSSALLFSVAKTRITGTAVKYTDIPTKISAEPIKHDPPPTAVVPEMPVPKRKAIKDDTPGML